MQWFVKGWEKDKVIIKLMKKKIYKGCFFFRATAVNRIKKKTFISQDEYFS